VSAPQGGSRQRTGLLSSVCSAPPCSGVPRWGQMSLMAEILPSLVRNSTIASPRMATPSGLVPTSLDSAAVASRCQQMLECDANLSWLVSRTAP
jgi:hypothetical protein